MTGLIIQPSVKLNRSQNKLYNELVEKLINKLSYYIDIILKIPNPITRQKTLNTIYFSVEACLSVDKKVRKLYKIKERGVTTKKKIDYALCQNKQNLERICWYFFPADSHQSIRQFFCMLHELFHGLDHHHPLINNIIDLKTSKITSLDVGILLQSSLHSWLQQEREKKRYKQQELLKLAEQLKDIGLFD